MQFLKKIAGLAGFCILTACGGGGGSDTPAPAVPVAAAPLINARPNANPGADQQVFVGDLVKLDGGASSDGNGDVLTYKWRLVSWPVASVAALASNNKVQSTFTADVAGVYTVELVVNDGKIDGLPENINILAESRNSSSSLGLLANGGPNQNVSVGASVSLDGGLSSDAKRRIITYNWTLIAKPANSTALLIDPAAKKTKFVADVAGLYGISFFINAGNEKSLPVNIFVTASSSVVGINFPPVANAGSDQAALTGTVIALDGGLSTDANGDSLSYLWNLQSKPVLSMTVLTTPTNKTSKFTADVAGIYELALVVNDGKSNSKTDVINVVVRPRGVVDIVDTGKYKCSNISKEQALSLFAQGHTYLDKDHDGRPCETNDILNEYAIAPIAPSTPNTAGNKCYVSGYFRKNGTYVKGYTRSC